MKCKEMDYKTNLALSDHDEGKLWDAYDSARSHFLSKHEQLIAEKERLHGIDAWAMEAPDWNEKLIERAEALRGLISGIYGLMPDDYWVRQRVLKVKMTDELAHSLTYLAHAYTDLEIERSAWQLNKLQSNFELKQKFPDLISWTTSDTANIEIERAMVEIKGRLPALKARVWEEFKNAESQNSSTVNFVKA